MLLIIKCC